MFYLFFWCEVAPEGISTKGGYLAPFGGKCRGNEVATYTWSNALSNTLSNCRVEEGFIESSNICPEGEYTFNCQRQLNKESSNISILSRKQIVDLLVNNPPDNYYDSLTQCDFKARGVNSLDEYLHNIESFAIPDSSIFAQGANTRENKKKIIDCIKQIEREVAPFGTHKYDWVDGARFRALPWIVAVVYGDKYEYGFPHTRGNVIIITDKTICIDTLLHEKLHVYQKMFPEDFQNYLDSEKFIRYCKRKDIQDVAANPDADSWVYMRDGEVYVGQYSRGGYGGAKSIVYKPINSPKYDCPQEFSI